MKIVENLNTRLLRRTVPLVGGCLLATACSMLTLGYPMLPNLAARQADKYFELDQAQRERIDHLLDDFLAWHRREELPLLAQGLERISTEATHRTSGVQVARWREVVEERWTATAKRLARPAAEMALTLRPEQLETLRQRFDDSNRELRDKVLADDPADRLAARLRRIEERAEYFFGELNDRQKAEILRLGPRLPQREEVWFAERLARQQRILAVLARIVAERPAQATATRWMHALLADFWKSDDAARAEAMARSMRETELLTAALINAAEPHARRKAAQRLAGWASDFVRLAEAATGG